MKTVGIFLKEFKSNSNKNLYAIRSDLITFLSQYNINLICIPLDYECSGGEYTKILNIMNLCDGFIIPGGSNIHDIDLKIVQYIHKIDKPLLGICLGMQTICETFGGTLQNISNHQSNLNYVHEINIKPNSKLNSILKEENILVNSRHNEGVITTDLDIVAYCSDNIIEAVEDKTKKFFIGVEWHPESLINDIYSKYLFDAFIQSL